MLIDARTVPAEAAIDADLCVVGAGPAGISLVLELAQTGMRICLLESGGEEPTREAQRLARGENGDSLYYRLHRTRMRAFGGTSNHWDRRGMTARPLDSTDFLERPEIGRGGWPFTREHLEPYYKRAQEIARLGPYDYEPTSWSGERAEDVCELGADVSTTMFQWSETENFQRYRSEMARLTNVQVLLNAAVLELVTDDAGDRLERVRATTGQGRSFTVTARSFVLAAGGIENARLLLLSRRRHRNGIGNHHDLVGRFFMEHLRAPSGVLHPTDPATAESLLKPYQVRWSHGTRIWWALRPTEQTLRREKILTSSWTLRLATPALVSDTARALLDMKKMTRDYRRYLPGTAARARTLVKDPADIARVLSSVVRRRRGSADLARAQMVFSAEQAPNPLSRISLGDRVDEHGQRQARLDWCLTELDYRSIRVAQDRLDAAFRSAGIGRLEAKFGDEFPPVALGGQFHHLGTTRMAPDARHGVVDSNGRVYGVANLFITGSSVFPTSGFSNPTLTVVALAVRLAEHLRTIHAR